MAKFESDKEDLIADATALVERAEYLVHQDAQCSWRVVTIGFRKDGALSVYLDQDPYFQFDATGQLRRAYVNGLLYRSQGDTLAELQRQRSAAQTTLQRTDLTAAQLETFRHHMLSCLGNLKDAFAAGHLLFNRAVPEGSCLQEQTQKFLGCVFGCGTNFLSKSIRMRK